MGSNLFTKMGLGSLDLGIVLLVMAILILILIIIVIVLINKSSKLQARYERFMQGEKAKSLENEIHDLIKQVSNHEELLNTHSNEIDEIFKKHEGAFQKMSLIKYDAFKEMGGKLSCCLCLLDENDNGFIMNNVHSSTGCYSYTKRIRQGGCDLELSQEEKVTLDKAMGMVDSKK